MALLTVKRLAATVLRRELASEFEGRKLVTIDRRDSRARLAAPFKPVHHPMLVKEYTVRIESVTAMTA